MNRPTPRPRHQAGLSLLELLIAVTLGLLLLGGLLTVYSASSLSYRVAENTNRMQEGARHAFSIIGSQVRSAGYLGCFSGPTGPTNLAVPSIPFTPQTYLVGHENIGVGNHVGTLAGNAAVNGTYPYVAGNHGAGNTGSDALSVRRASVNSIALNGNVANTRRPPIPIRANTLGLLASTLYLGWSVGAQGWMTHHARQSLAARGLPAERVLITPAPLTTLLWRMVSVDDTHYHEGYYAWADRGRAIQFRSYPRGTEALGAYASHPHIPRIARFSDGFYRLRWVDGELWLADLRMGQEPYYVFEFNLGPPVPPGSEPSAAVRVGQRVDSASGLPWLWARLQGQEVPPLGEVLAQPRPGPRPPSASMPNPIETSLPSPSPARLP